MNLWIVLLIGILIGWLLEWIIDWVYWRKKANGEDQSAELKAAQEKIAALEAELEDCGEVRIDPLEKIKGIGPVIKKKLNAGGIFSFKQLSKLTAADLEAIVGEEIKRLADEDVIINQAKEFAEKE
ncbi:MAG: DUF1049 domain-containing protein [Anaerolineae bacterium]|jgi:predicted flap endonuclease-1-like 5' DNA nuclease|nr:DUF1049 domain-containing protein [Anaerolineae bacterium]MBT7070686.1 DUF1049 domain-containing protein [Anaerolineae bacterium]MBT7326594.1 DUF1049 domain-containing protein [Anaerolineae bacterium]